MNTPNWMSSHLTITDYGEGLDLDDIREIYSQYGASTKRNTNAQTGMLGLGCKSALTLVNRFTIESIKNGKKYLVAVGLNEEGAGEMSVVSITDTTRPSGTTIKIPHTDSYRLEEKAEKFFSFWPQGSVLLNGNEPHKIQTTPITKEVHLTSLRESLLVMGNVPYPINYKLGNKSIIIWAEIGAVNFVPSREDLHYTSKTKDYLAEKLKEFEDKYLESLQKQMDDFPTYKKAFSFYEEMSDLPLARQLTYKGYSFSGLFSQMKKVKVDDGKEIEEAVRFYTLSGYNNVVYPQNYLPYSDLFNHTFIVNFPYKIANSKLTPSFAKKLKIWLDQNKLSKQQVIGTTDMLTVPFTNEMKFVDFEEIKAIKIPRVPVSGIKIKEIPLSYDVILPGETYSKEVSPDMFPAKLQILYYGPFDAFSSEKLTGGLAGSILVRIGENRRDKFLRKFPNAIRLKDAIPLLKQQVEAGMTEEDKIFLSLESSRGMWQKLASYQINDPDVAKWAKVASEKKAVDEISIFNGWVLGLYGYYSNQSQANQIKPKAFVSPLLKYPVIKKLTHSFIYDNAEDVVKIINNFYVRKP